MKEQEQVYVTTQLTSKRFKLHAMLSTATITFGVLMVLMAGNDTTTVWGCLIALVGFFWKAVNRIRIWWNHS